ncbi:MAG: hypothetical protein KJ941_09740 [Bacteroidetes bacterium]|nr:hypothetical protein [Bacteroidota bacterium]
MEKIIEKASQTGLVVILLTFLFACSKPIEETGTLYTIEGQFFYDCAQTLPAKNRGGSLLYAYPGGMKLKYYDLPVTSDGEGKLEFGYYAAGKSYGLDGSDHNTVNLYRFVNNLPHAQNLKLGKVTIGGDVKYYIHIKPENAYSELDTLLFINIGTPLFQDGPIPGPFKDTLIGPFHLIGDAVKYKDGKYGFGLGIEGFLKRSLPDTMIYFQKHSFMCNCEDSLVIDLILK